MSTRRPRGFANRRPADSERGSVLVELTMVLPLLLTLVLGMMEMGMAWRDQQTITQASRQGARVGSSLGQDASADQQAVAAAMAVLDDEQRANIKWIMIYEPANGDGDPTPACQNVIDGDPAGNGGIPGQCNVWGSSDLQSASFDATTLTSPSWAPGSRKDTLENTPLGNGPDRLGIMIEVYRPWFTGYFPGDGTDIRAKTIMQLEPDIS